MALFLILGKTTLLRIRLASPPKDCLTFGAVEFGGMIDYAGLF